VLLGDGAIGWTHINVINPDPEVRAAVTPLAAEMGLRIADSGVSGGGCPVYGLRKTMGKHNPLRQQLTALGFQHSTAGTKFIPRPYQIASRADRLQLLAGLMDTDGYHAGLGQYDYVTKSAKLAHDLVFIARSVGLYAVMTPCIKRWQFGVGQYYRVYLSGDIAQIPCRIPRKQAQPRTLLHSPLHVGFTVEPMGIGEYYGFTCDGDHRYLLGDFTVTHNSGKGLSTIIPTLLDWPESVLVLDPKDGENYDLTARWRRQCSQVHAFMPCRRPQACINVLDTIRLGTPQALSDAQLIAQSLTAPAKFQTEGATGAHFRELATMLLTAAILHQCCAGARRSLAGVWDFLTQHHETLSQALQTMIETPYEDPDTEAAIVSITRAIQNISGDRELSSVWTTAIRPLVLYSDPLVAASTDTSTFPLESLQYGPRPVSLYLIAPSPMTLERLHPVYRVVLDVLMVRLMDHKVRTWDWRLLNCLDELPWYGYCRAIDKGIAVQAGYGHKNLVVTQDFSSLLEVYGQHTALFGNCHVKVFHTPDNDLTAKRISENLLGPATVDSTGRSTTRGQSMSQSVNTHAVRRLLMTTDEVMDIPAHLELIRVSGCKPILAAKLDYRQEWAWQDRWTAPASPRSPLS
jgi:type IV secretory pathway TraG/TraD family ATPase VirD4